jgi:hypothetical protein
MGFCDVFFSYSSKDFTLASSVVSEFKAFGLDVWLDRDNMRVDDSLPQSPIAEGVNDALILCVLFTSNSAQSLWVKREVDSFSGRDDNTQITSILSRIVYLLYFDKREFDEGLASDTLWNELKQRSVVLRTHLFSSDDPKEFKILAKRINKDISELSLPSIKLPNFELSTRIKMAKEFWLNNFILRDWGLPDFNVLLPKLETLKPPYNHWFNRHKEPFDDKIEKILRMSFTGERRHIFHKDPEFGLRMIYPEQFKSLLNITVSGKPTQLLTLLGTDSNIVNELQHAYYSLRTLHITDWERILLDLTVILSGGYIVDYWLRSASINEIVNCLIREEDLSNL